MKPIQQHKDPRINNVSFENFTGSVYIIDSKTTEEDHSSELMLTSSQTNRSDHFIPSHHLALITQPVLGARSRSRKQATITTTTMKDKLDPMTNSRRNSYNDSPPLILPINRIDTSQFQKKTTNFHSHQESSDSGVDLSFSTNSSVQPPQQHIPIHRPLSALNEDASPDDGYHDEHQQNPDRLRFPPVSFGRNRSMEDMISNNIREQQQHRSSSFSHERQQKLSLQNEQKILRINEGALLDSSSESTERSRQSNSINKNELIYPSITQQQHRSLNDLTTKTSNKAFPTRNESNTFSMMNNLPTTQTVIRKPNTSTLKPLRKKTKLNILVEPSIPLTSSRLTVYDEQIIPINGTTSSSSNQTTPRSIRPIGQQQQIKPKASTTLSQYANQEQIRAHVNRSVVERQHPPSLPPPPPPPSLPPPPPPRRGVIQQIIPFDASPSKVNNLLLRHHHLQQNQPTILFHPSSTSQLSPSRQLKQTLPILYNDETISTIPDDKNKQMKFKEQRFKEKIKEPIGSKMISKRRNSQDHFEQQTNFPQQEKEFSFERNRRKKIDDEQFIYRNTPNRQYQIEGIYREDNRSKRTNINERYGSGHSNGTTMDNTKIDRRQKQQQQGNIQSVQHIYRSDGELTIQKSKPTEFVFRKKTQNHTNDKSPSQMSNVSNHYGSDYSHNTHVDSQTRQSQIEQNHPHSNQWKTDSHPWQKSQITSQTKSTRIGPLNSNYSDSRRDRETSRLSNTSKTDSIKKNPPPAHFPLKSPTSRSIISDHQQQSNMTEKTSPFQTELSISPSSQDDLIEEDLPAPSRTYRLTVNEQQQSTDGRHVIPSTNLRISSLIDHTSYPSSGHTYPFTCTPDIDENLIDETSQTKKSKSIPADIYILSDHENSHDSPSPLVHLTSKKIFSPPPPPPTTTKNVLISTEKEEMISNYDSDDGWSDDSAELLYVDERYAKDKGKKHSSSHLPSQQHYHYQLQQQNVLLQ